MKNKIGLLLVVLAGLLFASASAVAGDFFIDTNQLGYSYTAWNITHPEQGTYGYSDQNGAWLYTTQGLGSPADANIFIAMPNDFQLWDDTSASTTSAGASWDPTFTTFTASVSGGSLPSGSYWQIFYEGAPVDYFAGIDYVNYNYQLTATFANPAVFDPVSGLMVNSDPISLAGTFTGTFLASYDTGDNPIPSPDTYGFNVAFYNQAVDWDGEYTNQFGAPVPEPSTLLLLATGVGAICLVRRKRTKA